VPLGPVAKFDGALAAVAKPVELATQRLVLVQIASAAYFQRAV